MNVMKKKKKLKLNIDNNKLKTIIKDEKEKINYMKNLVNELFPRMKYLAFKWLN